MAQHEEQIPNQTHRELLIRIALVQTITGLTRSTLYGLIKRGEFPKQVQLSKRTVAWKLAEVQQWAKDRQAAA
jgi:prophage regulatory protein